MNYLLLCTENPIIILKSAKEIQSNSYIYI